MIVVMKQGSSPKQVEHVVQLVREMGLKDHVIVGTERTVVAVIGNDRFKDRNVFETVDGVEKVVPILAAYKMASREIKKGRSVVPMLPSSAPNAGNAAVGGKRVGIIAGPCSVESKNQLLEIAHAVRKPVRWGFAAGRSNHARTLTRSRAWRRRASSFSRWRASRRGWRWSRK